jgi:hypothetical protein
LITYTNGGLPTCTGTIGCRSGNAFTTDLTAAGTYQCTQYTDAMDLPDPDVVTSGSFRIDTIVEAHPDVRQAGAQVVIVSVCWEDQAQRVQQVQARKVIIPFMPE